MKLVFAGGAMEVGGSCVYIRTGNKGVLLDAGIRQNSVKDPLPDFRTIQQNGGVDAIVVSHAHMDHTGSLPVISRAYPAAKIYMTSMTAALTKVLLADSLKVMDRREEEIPVYGKTDVEVMLERIVPVSFQSPYEILDEMRITFYPAGHIAGAACVYLETAEGTVLYTGDVSSFAQRTIEGVRLPKLRPDVMIMESTYGNRLHSNRQAEEIRLVNTVAECIGEGKKILIPAFALGRAQEVLLILRSAMGRKALPEVPVYVDGMVRDINRVYSSYPTFLRSAAADRITRGRELFYNDNITAVGTADDRAALTREKGSAVFVASSGMLAGGPSMVYARELAPREDACIIITGYQDEESPGRALLNLMEETEDRRIVLEGSSVKVNCRVEMVGLSAHSDRSELIGLVEKLQPRRLFLVHGNEEAISSLGEDLSSDYRRQIYQPYAGETIDIDIGKKRKQLSDRLPNTMDHNHMPGKEDMVHFRIFWNTWYRNRSLTIEQCYTMWTGVTLHVEKMTEEQDRQLSALQEAMLSSPWFTRDKRRLYLIRPATEEEIAETGSAEATIQDVETVLKEALGNLEYRKLSFHQSERAAEVIMDFPDTFSETLRESCSARLLEKTGWSFTVSDKVNHQSAAVLLNELFPEGCGKISYYSDQKAYMVNPAVASADDEFRKQLFFEKTGWSLWINQKPEGYGNARKTMEKKEGWYIPSVIKPLEQNAALAMVEEQFGSAEIRPYKKGVKTDQYGKYMELSFLSPALGRRCEQQLQELAETTGTRVHISESVNQNTLSVMVMDLCKKYGVSLLKNPSYLPQEQCFALRLDHTLPEAAVSEFEEKTGITIKKI